ncbi:MAG: MEDS domain-containing protein, partial [Deltaproteobacteria bacterium]|nr:MEDS domain-containing protein [Deltaproteobacteria bacterium]
MSSSGRQVRLGFTDEPFPEGTHMCHIFSDEEEQGHVISRYISSGLAGGEQACYFADAMTVEETRARLAGLGVPIPAADDKALLVASAV